ncbi:hypothetical protein NHQ30_009318 [Ciborinia camelliae]|nr:hypothetical protein NHQ30_009318 [Ciborinia camelliae]
MEPISSIAAVGTLYELVSRVGTLCFRYAQGVRRADTEADNILDEIHNFQTALRKLKGMLQDEGATERGSDRLQSLREIASEDSVSLKSCQVELEKFQAILLEDEKVQEGLKGQAKALLRKMKWPLKQEDIKRLMDNMRNVAAQIERAQSIDTTQMIRGISTTLESTSERVDSVKSTVENAAAQQEEEDRKRKEKERLKEIEELKTKIGLWLNHADQNENHNIACGARDKKAMTGQWFVEGQRFESFRKENHSLLWLHGDPGCGKTVLSSTIIESLKSVSGFDRKTTLGFWYFNANDKAKMTLNDCVRALITQFLGSFLDRVPVSIEEFWTNHSKGNWTPKIPDLETALEKLVMTEKIAYFIVLDALDECREEDQADLLEMIKALLANENQDIHILVTSRSYLKDKFCDQFKDKRSFFDNPIDRSFVDKDIASHIKQQLLTDYHLSQWTEDNRNLIFDSLIAKAEGMFRWVDCQLQALRKCKKKSALIKTLETLPKNLHEQYVRELANVPSDNAKEALTLLKWLTFPQRKLRVEEVVELLDVDYESEEQGFIPEDRIDGSDYVLGLCGSLVRTDINKRGYNHLGDKAEVKTLTTSHATVLDFLKGQRIKVGQLDPVNFTPASVNLQLATTCLIYLNSLFQLGVALNEDTLRMYPCARFCAEYWDDYYREVLASPFENLDLSRLNRLALKLMDSEESTLKWVQLCNPENDQGRVNFCLRKDQLRSKLYYASLLGLTNIVEHYIDQGEDVKYMTTEGFGTSLAAAAYFGRTQVVNCLLKAGADPNAIGKLGNCLNAAIYGSHKDVVQLLLDANADPNKKSDEIEYPIIQACGFADSCDEILKILLENGADANIGIGDDSYTDFTPIQAARTINQIDILVKYGADINQQTKARPSPLTYAVLRNREDMVTHLLNKGADTHQKHPNYSFPLSTASRRGSKTILQAFIGRANIDAMDEYYGSALHHAAIEGNLDAIETLLNAGANPNLTHWRKGSAFMAGMQYSFPVMTSLESEVFDLLYKNTTNHAKNIMGQNAILFAARCSQWNFVERLIENGHDIRSIDGMGCNMLHYAAREGNARFVKRALDSGIDVNSLDSYGWSALHWAASSEYGTAKAIHLLLRERADKGIKDKQGKTPLDLAVEFDRPIMDYSGYLHRSKAYRFYLRGNSAFISLTPYFEITILSRDKENRRNWTAIGLALESAEAKFLVGMESNSYGYRGDGMVCNSGNRVRYGEPYETGDTIGCGLDPYLAEIDKKLRAVFWTKNGRHCGSIAVSVSEDIYPIFSCDLLTGGLGVKFKVNWGEKDFMWKREKWDGKIWDGEKWGEQCSYWDEWDDDEVSRGRLRSI